MSSPSHPRRSSLGRLSESLHRIEVERLVEDLDKEIADLESTVVYWQTLFEESQKEASGLRSRVRELEKDLHAAYYDGEDRPQYLETKFDENAEGRAVPFAPVLVENNQTWGFFNTVKHFVGNSNRRQ